MSGQLWNCLLRAAGGVACALLALTASERPAAAQSDGAAQTNGAAPQTDSVAGAGAAPAASGSTDVSFALGVSLGFLRQEGFSTPDTEFIPSLLGLAYVPVAPRLFLRPALRLGYVGLTQPSASYGARIDEHGMQATLELGLAYDAWLVPALALGGGANYRSIDFVGRGIVADSDAIDRSEWLGLLFAQAGVGLPIFRGALVIEPYARLQYTLSDNRSLLQFGADLTFEL